MVSVIIPVYNVVEYIDKCLESIINQTFKNIEIILINDGSTDGSEKKCIEWAKRDKRIIYISKKNEGPGTTRNLGIKMAKGKYITFIDSDDWYELNAIEEMYYAISFNNADIVYFDYYRVFLDETKSNKIRKQEIKNFHTNQVTNVYIDKELISSVSVIICNKIYKKSIFFDNKIKIENFRGEDLAIFPALFFSAKRIFSVNKPLYNYVFRKGSTTNNPTKLLEEKMSLEKYINFCKKDKNVFEKFYIQIKKVFFDAINSTLTTAKMQLSELEYIKIKKIYTNFVYVHFPELKRIKNILESNLLIWGSYNARMVASYLTLASSNSIERYSYSSIISAMTNNNQENRMIVFNENKYRENMIKADVQKSFLNKSKEYFKTYNFIIIDLLEEVYDILLYEDIYFTKSDVFDESVSNINIINSNIIDILSIKRWELWKSKSEQFLNLLKKHFKPEQIILLKIKLAEKYGSLNNVKEYNNVEKIRNINYILEQYYKFIEEQLEGVVNVEVLEEKYLFTDKYCEFGCNPNNLNIYYFQELAEQIFIKLEEMI